MMKNTRPAKNFPSTNSCDCIGKVSSSSQVFCFLSSAQMRMVTAGRKMHMMSGRVLKKLRMSATSSVKNGVMNRPTLSSKKTIMKM